MHRLAEVSDFPENGFHQDAAFFEYADRAAHTVQVCDVGAFPYLFRREMLHPWLAFYGYLEEVHHLQLLADRVARFFLKLATLQTGCIVVGGRCIEVKLQLHG